MEHFNVVLKFHSICNSATNGKWKMAEVYE